MKQNTVTVVFDTPGVASIGPYQHGIKYDVAADEAQRLIKVKGFRRVDAGKTATTENED